VKSESHNVASRQQAITTTYEKLVQAAEVSVYVCVCVCVSVCVCLLCVCVCMFVCVCLCECVLCVLCTYVVYVCVVCVVCWGVCVCVVCECVHVCVCMSLTLPSHHLLYSPPLQARHRKLGDSIRQFALFRECDEVESWINERVCSQAFHT